jgi:hypothetical protein
MANRTDDDEKIRRASIIQGLRQTIHFLEMALSSLESDFQKEFPAEGLHPNDPKKPESPSPARELRDFL